jgi:hypothetical protein
MIRPTVARLGSCLERVLMFGSIPRSDLTLDFPQGNISTDESDFSQTNTRPSSLVWVRLHVWLSVLILWFALKTWSLLLTSTKPRSDPGPTFRPVVWFPLVTSGLTLGQTWGPKLTRCLLRSALGLKSLRTYDQSNIKVEVPNVTKFWLRMHLNGLKLY